MAAGNTQEAKMTHLDPAAAASSEPQLSEPHRNANQLLEWGGPAFACYALIVTIIMASTTEFNDYRIVSGLLVFSATIAVGIRLGLRFFACLAPLCFVMMSALMPEGGVLHSFQYQLIGTVICSQAVTASFILKPFDAIVPEPQRRRALKQSATLAFFALAGLAVMYWGIINR
jgi:hypothetical protein